MPTRLSVCVVEVKEISEGLQCPGTEHHQGPQTGLGALRGGEGERGVVRVRVKQGEHSVTDIECLESQLHCCAVVGHCLLHHQPSHPPTQERPHSRTHTRKAWPEGGA